ncbi:FIG137884: hypothetical protein [hydrothermal vent metagenome]|uniref:DUF2520 domain-containing protein n=1 Tax=hydrothermal vent metagenome TaxID=652676 RepID=A0A3B0QYJ9_9ZZZZ
MIKVVLLGAGNVAFHLAKVFDLTPNIDFVQQFRRNNKNDGDFQATTLKTDKIDKLASADIYVIAINDDAITDFSKQLNLTKGLVVHTSGSMPLSALACKANKGVFYPLQTFSKEQSIDFKSIPITIEAENKEDTKLLFQFAKSISKHVYEINSSQREKLHIAAVFANNFTNHMYSIAKEICDSSHINFDILKPLIKETSEKVQKVDPKLAQTGPAKRNDQKIIKKHLSQISGQEKEIYALISKSIINKLNS